MKSMSFIFEENAVFLKEIAIFCNPAYKVLYVNFIQTFFGDMKLNT